LIDLEVFGQIVELDDEDETREFSRGMTFAFFVQAAETLDKMDEAL
jgi:osomolarity two-component system phosphorelay intermediate protein YPD1